MTTPKTFSAEALVASPSETLAEALRIVRGETMMLATKKHLVALAELWQIDPLLVDDLKLFLTEVPNERGVGEGMKGWAAELLARLEKSHA